MEVDAIREKAALDALKRQLRGGPNGLRNLAAFCLGINTGYRACDLLALRVGDVLDASGRVRRELASAERKTGKARRVPLNRGASAPLAAWLASRAPDGVASRLDPEAWLFPSRQGGPLSRKTLHHELREAGKAVGLPRVGTHTMRKTFGYFTYRGTGNNIGLVQRLLNHSKPSETLRYIGVDREAMDEAVFGLDI